MNANEKQDFLEVINKTADLYSKTIPRERVSVYWEALKHRTLTDIKTAINRHVQDADRGRFFPLPADVSHQLPNELNAWLSANEAWAACPKDEDQSSAMCDEIAQSLFIAQDLINMGDMVAARMAFIEYYNRLMETAKSEGRKPKWFTSYGMDKELRHNADREVVERKNLALPKSEWLPLPELMGTQQIEFKDLMRLEAKHNSESDENKEKHRKAASVGLGDIRGILKR